MFGGGLFVFFKWLREAYNGEAPGLYGEKPW